jgi:hypothetical protein
MATSLLRDFESARLDIPVAHCRNISFFTPLRPASLPLVGTNQGVRAMTGLLIAFGVEAVAALCLVGLWQIWHHLR